jgi:frataxin-like iron-binding protein CyaY
MKWTVRGVTIFLILFSFLFCSSGCKKSETEKASVTTIDKALPDGAFKAKILIKDRIDQLKVGTVSKIIVSVRNDSSHIWPAKGQPGGPYTISLAYHWLDKDGKVVVWDGLRTSLPYDLKPGNEVTLNASVKAPEKPGDYILEFDMVQEKVAWFKWKGSETAKLNIVVK